MKLTHRQLRVKLADDCHAEPRLFKTIDSFLSENTGTHTRVGPLGSDRHWVLAHVEIDARHGEQFEERSLAWVKGVVTGFLEANHITTV